MTINKITAFLSVDLNGTEGVITAQIGNQMYPLITGDERMIQKMLEIAQPACRQNGVKLKIVQYTEGKDVTEEIEAKYKTLIIS